MRYLTNTFSPLMMGENVSAVVRPAEITDVPADCQSAVSHKVTAGVLSALLGRDIPFNRVNLTLKSGDTVFCVIPDFRASEAREFTRAEVEGAGYRVFRVDIAEG